MHKMDEQRAGAAAAVTAFVVSLLYYVMYSLSPMVYAFFLRAQVFGGNIGDITPAAYSFSEFLGSASAYALMAWIAGLVFARVYNEMHKGRGRSSK